MKRIAAISALVLALLFFPSQEVVAANDCEVARTFPNADNNATLDARVCIGGFSSRITANQPLNVTVKCTGKSLGIGNLVTWCNTAQSKTVVADPFKVEPDGKSGFYTCFDVQGINRDVGQIAVQFKSVAGTPICQTEPFSTVPADYSLSERIVRAVTSRLDGGYNAGNAGSAGNLPLFCEGADGTSINTAIGCIPTEPGALFSKFFSVGIGIAGGIAFLLILFGGFQILVSAGNPEQLTAGKELVTSAIAGLLLIIFSVFLLRVIGVDILGIPKFG